MIPQFQPFIDLEYSKEVSKQIDSGWVGTGETTEKFENKVKDLFNCKYGISTTSGTIALLMAVESLKLSKEDIILFPAYTFLAGANACKFMGHDVRLVDIKEDTLCMNPEEVERILKCEQNVGAIIFVDHNGYHGEDLYRILNICCEYGIPLIEDAAQCVGMLNNIVGDIATVSFSVPKLITTGQGGMVITDTEHYSTMCKQIRDHGDNWRKERIHNNLGINLKFNDILASFGLAQLNNLDNLLLKRKEIWDEYRKYIDIIDYGYESTWMVIYRSKNVLKIVYELKKNGISAVQYYMPICDNPPFKSGNDYPIARKVYEEIVYLPSSLTLTKEDVKKICEIILDVEK